VPPRPSAGLPLLLLAAALALGWNLNGYRLLDPDEGRNAEVAREMARTNDYLVPHLDGLPYLDKPIVYFAASAALMEVLGPTETAARLPAYLATLATVALLVWFGRRRWGPEAGWLAGVAFATMPLTLAYAHTAIFDSTLTLCTTAAIICFFEERATLAWAALAVGALTKGPVAIAVPLVVAMSHALATGAPLRRVVSVRALAAFAVVALPWFLAVTARIPEFPHYAFVRETFERFTTPGFHRTAPFWYYLPIIPVAAFPWIVPACARLGGLGRWRATWSARREPAAREPLWLVAWVLGPLALFTLNESKLPQYVLPLMPAFALAAARTVAAAGPRVAWRPYVALAGALAVVVILLTERLVAPLPLTLAARLAIPPAALALGIALLASAGCVAVAATREWATLGAVGYALVVISLPFGTGALLRAVGDDRSAARLAAAIRPLVDSAGATVLGVAAYPPSLPFYLGTTIAVATAGAEELTSNYLVAYADRYRALPDSPLKPADSWKAILERCLVPTVFVTRAGNRGARAALAVLPLVADDGRYVAYGPCRPGVT
jgi:4-amino-4-deoxy-L-arabinose transferase-like glycosyltransferase